MINYQSFIKVIIFIIVITISLFNHANTEDENRQARVIIAHLGELPGLINADKTGPFVDLIHAIDELYPEVSIDITVYPLTRALSNVGKGLADFGLPAMRKLKDADTLPYQFSSVSFGKVTHVIYSNVHNPVTRDMAYKINKTNQNLRIEANPDSIALAVKRSLSIEQSLKKLSRGRIDAFIWAQEEADFKLNQLGLKNIRREFFGEFEDVFFIKRGTEGNDIDKFLTESIEQLKRSKKLEEIYSKIHKPYSNWQPSE